MGGGHQWEALPKGIYPWLKRLYGTDRDFGPLGATEYDATTKDWSWPCTIYTVGHRVVYLLTTADLTEDHKLHLVVSALERCPQLLEPLHAALSYHLRTKENPTNAPWMAFLGRKRADGEAPDLLKGVQWGPSDFDHLLHDFRAVEEKDPVQRLWNLYHGPGELNTEVMVELVRQIKQERLDEFDHDQLDPDFHYVWGTIIRRYGETPVDMLGTEFTTAMKAMDTLTGKRVFRNLCRNLKPLDNLPPEKSKAVLDYVGSFRDMGGKYQVLNRGWCQKVLQDPTHENAWVEDQLAPLFDITTEKGVGWTWPCNRTEFVRRVLWVFANAHIDWHTKCGILRDHVLPARPDLLSEFGTEIRNQYGQAVWESVCPKVVHRPWVEAASERIPNTLLDMGEITQAITQAGFDIWNGDPKAKDLEGVLQDDWEVLSGKRGGWIGVKLWPDGYVSLHTGDQKEGEQNMATRERRQSETKDTVTLRTYRSQTALRIEFHPSNLEWVLHKRRHSLLTTKILKATTVDEMKSILADASWLTDQDRKMVEDTLWNAPNVHNDKTVRELLASKWPKSVAPAAQGWDPFANLEHLLGALPTQTGKRVFQSLITASTVVSTPCLIVDKRRVETAIRSATYLSDEDKTWALDTLNAPKDDTLEEKTLRLQRHFAVKEWTWPCDGPELVRRAMWVLDCAFLDPGIKTKAIQRFLDLRPDLYGLFAAQFRVGGYNGAWPGKEPNTVHEPLAALSFALSNTVLDLHALTGEFEAVARGRVAEDPRVREMCRHVVDEWAVQNGDIRWAKMKMWPDGLVTIRTGKKQTVAQPCTRTNPMTTTGNTRNTTSTSYMGSGNELRWEFRMENIDRALHMRRIVTLSQDIRKGKPKEIPSLLRDATWLTEADQAQCANMLMAHPQLSSHGVITDAGMAIMVAKWPNYKRPTNEPTKAEEPTTNPVTDQSTIDRVKTLLVDEAKEMAFRSSVRAVKRISLELLGQFLERRGTPAEFLGTEGGQGLVALFVGSTWALLNVGGDREFGDRVARELRVMGGTDLLGGFVESVITPLSAEMVRLVPGNLAAGGNGGGRRT